MAITVTDAQYVICVAALRRCINFGTNLTGEEKALVLDVLLGGTQSDAAFTDIPESDFVDGRAT